MASGSSESPRERQWFIVGRWQEFAGEKEANLLRLAAIIAFYCVQLIQFYGFLDAEQRLAERRFHILVTALAIAWAMMAMGVYWCLRFRLFPVWLKFISTGVDVILLTSILTLAAGPRSPLVIAYFVILAAAALRLSLPLIWFGAAACACGYLTLLGYARWFPGAEETRVPRYYQLIFFVGLVLTGIVLGRVIRRVRQLAEDFSTRITTDTRNVP